MPSSEWLSFDEAARIVVNHLYCSIGRAEKIVREARVTGEVRTKLWPGLNLRPGALVRGQPTPDWLLAFNSEDFLDWLNRTHAPPAHEEAPKQRGNYVQSKTITPDTLSTLWDEYFIGADNPNQEGFVNFGRDRGFTDRKALRDFYNEKMGRPGPGRRRKKSAKINPRK
jgi:hypothetical protein